MYKLELDKIIKEIKKRNSKQVLIQLPDGLKNKSNEIIDFIEDKTNAKAFIWFGDCYGACDLPLGVNSLNMDLIVRWGHNKFNKEIW